MAQRKKQRDEQLQRLQLLAQYRAWYEAFMHDHSAAIARSRLLRLRAGETNWSWLTL